MIVFDEGIGKRLACKRCGWLSDQELDFDHPCEQRCAIIASHTFGRPEFRSPHEIQPLIPPVVWAFVGWRHCSVCYIYSGVFHIIDTEGVRHTLIETPHAKCSAIIMRKVLG